MTRPNADEQLSAYLDGELTEAELSELEAELQRDPALRAELARIESAVSFLRTHGPVHAPDGFQRSVLDAVAAEPMPGSWWRWLKRPFGVPVEGLAVALVAALVLIVALPFGLQSSGDHAKDLKGDPYGFVRGEELRAAPGAAKLAQGEVGATPDPSAEPDAVADAASPPPPPTATSSRAAPLDEKVAAVASKEAAPDEAIADLDGARGTAASTSGGYGAGTPQVQAPTPAAPGVYAYNILTYDEDALLKLQRIAAKYRGQVLDAQGRPLGKGATTTGTAYLVEVPSSALAAFGDDLRALGMVTELPGAGSWAGGTVRVQVGFEIARGRQSMEYDQAPQPTNAQ